MRFPNILKLTVLLLSLLLPAVAKAQFTFVTNNGAIYINTYTGTGGAVVIPAATNGFSVVGISPAAFSTKSTITSVSIPNSITNIGFNAFLLCKGLTNVVIGAGVTSIGSEAFDFCQILPNLAIPDNVTVLGSNLCVNCFYLTNVTIGTGLTNLGSEAFDQCSNLQSIVVAGGNSAFSSLNGVLYDKAQHTLIQCPTKVTGSFNIPSTVTNIGVLAFDACSNLTSVTMPSVITIGPSAFSGCAQLPALSFPSTLISISDGAFNQCHGLLTVTIPAGATNIGAGVFGGCFNLTNITVDASNLNYNSLAGVLFDKNETVIIQFPEGKAGSYVVPNTVQNIGLGTFGLCFNLTSVTLGSSITNIGDYAFEACYALTNVTIPNGVTAIGQLAFYTCTNLVSITIPASVNSIGTFAFLSCSALASVYFEDDAPTAGYPTVGYGIFTSANPTLYYLPGRANWTSTQTQQAFQSLAVVLWNAQANTGDSLFGVRTNRFGFNISGTANIPILVEATTNLAQPSWIPLLTGTLTNGLVYFNDASWKNYPGRFYRIRSP